MLQSLRAKGIVVPDGSMADYSGDIDVEAAWADLKASPKAVLVDVRTTAEWTFVGLPNLASVGKETVLVAWNEFPPGQDLSDFTGRLTAELEARGIGTDASLYFLCRSGVRSRHAAIAATQAGYGPCYNVMRGFEGDLDAEGHRATEGSWKAAGLPWRQS